MTDRPAKPKDKFVVRPFWKGKGKPLTYIVVHLRYEWWANRGTWLAKDAETQVGGVEYASSDAALAEATRLNWELRKEDDPS